MNLRSLARHLHKSGFFSKQVIPNIYPGLFPCPLLQRKEGSVMTIQIAPQFMPIMLRSFGICAPSLRLLFKREAWGKERGGGCSKKYQNSKLSYALESESTNLYSIFVNCASRFQNLYHLSSLVIHDTSLGGQLEI